MLTAAIRIVLRRRRKQSFPSVGENGLATNIDLGVIREDGT